VLLIVRKEPLPDRTTDRGANFNITCSEIAGVILARLAFTDSMVGRHDYHPYAKFRSSIVVNGRLAFLNPRGTALGATNRRLKSVLPAALALSGYRLDFPVILFLGYRFDRCMLLDLSITFGTGRAVGNREPFHVAHVELAELAKGNGFDLAALVTSEEMKEEPSTMIRRESTPTTQALGLNLMSHRNLHCPNEILNLDRCFPYSLLVP